MSNIVELQIKDQEEPEESFSSLAQHWKALKKLQQTLEEDLAVLRDKLIRKANGRNVSQNGVAVTEIKPKIITEYKKIPYVMEMSAEDLLPYQKLSKETWAVRQLKEEL